MKFEALCDYLNKATASVFFIGYLPFVPGTFGSLAGVGLFYLLKGASWGVYFSTIFCLLILGILTCGKVEELTNKKDPGCIVIDEVIGMLVALSFMPYNLKIVFLAFIVFRILDTLKPFPAAKLAGMPGAAGVIGDDLVAGVYANIVLQAALKLLSFKIV